jgi:hypothetical protein
MKVKKPRKLPVKDKAYIAGIIDGEGCVAIHRRSGRGCKYGYSFYGVVRVSNTNLALLKWLQEVTGLGAVVESQVTGNRRRQWEWKVHSQQAYGLLKVLYPYLQVKKENADVLMSFLKFRRESEPVVRKLGGKGIPYNLWRTQKSFYTKMKKLNSRGLQ